MFKKRVLDNGIVVLTETIPYVTSSVVGFWMNIGSRYEDPAEAGYSHFIEHMLFKGTRKRSAAQIAGEVDKIGANMNAGTSKESTSYFIHAMDDYLDFSVEILCDIIQNSVFKRSEIEREKSVVLEEIKMYEDTPSEFLADVFMKTFIPDHPLGRPVIGTVDNIRSISREKILSFFRSTYFSDRLIVAIAGKLGSDRYLKRLEKLRLGQGKEKKELVRPEIRFRFAREHLERDVNQVQFILGFPGVSSKDPLRQAMYLLNAVLGGGMSSRLFQEIREKRGLCYSVYSSHMSYQDTGAFHIYCGTDLKSAGRTVEEILRICRSVAKNLISPKELHEAKTQFKGQMSLASENLEFLMNRMAMQERIYHRYISMQEMFREIDAVSLEDIGKLCGRIFGSEMVYHFTSIGPKHHARSFGF
jgi:predicted Zn-dependent peptidase